MLQNYKNILYIFHLNVYKFQLKSLKFFNISLCKHWKHTKNIYKHLYKQTLCFKYHLFETKCISYSILWKLFCPACITEYTVAYFHLYIFRRLSKPIQQTLMLINYLMVQLFIKKSSSKNFIFSSMNFDIIFFFS